MNIISEFHVSFIIDLNGIFFRTLIWYAKIADNKLNGRIKKTVLIMNDEREDSIQRNKTSFSMQSYLHIACTLQDAEEEMTKQMWYEFVNNFKKMKQEELGRFEWKIN